MMSEKLDKEKTSQEDGQLEIQKEAEHHPPPDREDNPPPPMGHSDQELDED